MATNQDKIFNQLLKADLKQTTKTTIKIMKLLDSHTHKERIAIINTLLITEILGNMEIGH